jgi:hypothetical protein
MYCLFGCKSKLSTSSKLLICKVILKPIWTYKIQLWGTPSTSNIEILERFKLKALPMIMDVPWFLPITVIQRDFLTPKVKDGTHRYNFQYNVCISVHPNDLVVKFLARKPTTGDCEDTCHMIFLPYS